MIRTLRAFGSLSVFALGTTLIGSSPHWHLRSGSEVVLTSTDGLNGLVVSKASRTLSRVTLKSLTTVTVTPDPEGRSISRQWVLPAGTELDLSLSQGQVLRRLESTHSLLLTISPDPGDGDPVPPGITTSNPSLGATPSGVDLSITPDPGQGDKYPPT